MIKNLVSVVMPTYNDSLYLEKAIDDILNQTYKDFELIIVDDGSTDNTSEILKEYKIKDSRIKILKKENGGTGSALNLGFQSARGEFGTWVSSDDEKRPEFLKELVECLKQNRDVEFVCSAFISKYLNKVFKPYHYDGNRFVYCRGLNHDSSVTGKVHIVDDWAEINSHACYQGVCFMFTMRLKKLCGPYIKIPGEDYHMTMLMGLNSRVCYLDKILGQHNNPEDSLSMQNRNCVAEANVLTRETYAKSHKWRLKKIPKIASFYWGSDKMSFLRYMTIKSFKKFNPDWSVHLYVPKTPSKSIDWRSEGGDLHHSSDSVDYNGEDYKDRLLGEVAVKVTVVDFSNSFIGSNAPEAHKSDLLTWKVLSTTGGIWCDMDILFTSPLNKSSINVNSKTDTISSYDMGHSRGLYVAPIGFLGSSKNNLYFKRILLEATRNYNRKSYQSIGTICVTNVAKDFESAKKSFANLNMINLDPESIYHLHFKKIDDIFLNNVKLPVESFGIHWYGGHPLSQQYNGKINIDNYSEYDNTICKHISEVLK